LKNTLPNEYYSFLNVIGVYYSLTFFSLDYLGHPFLGLNSKNNFKFFRKKIIIPTTWLFSLLCEICHPHYSFPNLSLESFQNVFLFEEQEDKQTNKRLRAFLRFRAKTSCWVVAPYAVISILVIPAKADSILWSIL
jgi:hypothetical protein